MTAVATFARDIGSAMIDEGAGEGIGVVATAAIRAGCDVVRYGGQLSSCIDRVVVVVAVCARLRYRVDDGMIENTTKVESCYVMTYSTINAH